MRARGAAAYLLVVAVLSGCATPALNRGAFLENGKGALDSAISATASARLALHARLTDAATRPFADVVVTDSESAIAPIENSFGGVDPPTPAEDDLRTAVLDAVGATGDALADARIAVRRNDTEAMQSAEADLATAEQALQTLRQSLE